MKRHDDAAEMVRLRRERDAAKERERHALAHRDQMQREMDTILKRYDQSLNRNQDIWLAASKLSGGLEALRRVPQPNDRP